MENINRFVKDWAETMCQTAPVKLPNSVEELREFFKNDLISVKNTPYWSEYTELRKSMEPVDALYNLSWIPSIDEFNASNDDLCEGSTLSYPKFCFGRMLLVAALLYNDPNIDQKLKDSLEFAEVLEDGFANLLISLYRKGEIPVDESVYTELMGYEEPHSVVKGSPDIFGGVTQFEAINKHAREGGSALITHPKTVDYDLIGGLIAHSMSLYAASKIPDDFSRLEFLMEVYEKLTKSASPTIAGTIYASALNAGFELANPSLEVYFRKAQERTSLERKLVELSIYPERAEEITESLKKRYGTEILTLVKKKQPLLAENLRVESGNTLADIEMLIQKMFLEKFDI